MLKRCPTFVQSMISAYLKAPSGLCECVKGLLWLRECVKIEKKLRECVNLKNLRERENPLFDCVNV